MSTGHNDARREFDEARQGVERHTRAKAAHEAAVESAREKLSREQSNRDAPEPKLRPRKGELGKMAADVDRDVAREQMARRSARETDAYRRAQTTAARQANERKREQNGLTQ